MKVSIGSLMSITSNWERGTMMSPTCISETFSAPSMIDSGSASSRLRWWAERSSVISCSRSSGSRSSSAERRSSRLGRDGSFMRVASFYRVGVVESETAQNADLGPFHARGMRLLLVVVALQVQHAVHHQVGVVRREGFSLLQRFARDDRMA